jgi:hypothetical protein
VGIEWRIVTLSSSSPIRTSLTMSRGNALLLVDAELVETVGEAAEESSQVSRWHNHLTAPGPA